MDFNTLLLKFGFNSSDFVNKFIDPIEIDNGLIYEVEEAYKKHICPFCNYDRIRIHDYKYSEKTLNSISSFQEILRIRRIRYKCPKCGKTHTLSLTGIERGNNVSAFTINLIKNEFYEIQSFSAIARRYGLSTNEVINIFDKYTNIMPRRPLPEYLCIDEKYFKTELGNKYVVILSDFFSGEVIDIIEGRKTPYLDEYFSSISLRERNNVKVVISDMYDGYSVVKNKYFKKAIFVVDLFHVIKLLTTVINRLRLRTCNLYTRDGSIERNFMKRNWKMFLIDKYKIHRNDFYSKKFDMHISYGDIILRCVQLNNTFWDGYNVLQELLHYDKYETYGEAEKFMNRIISKLVFTEDEMLIKVAESYRKWKVGIINGLARNQTGKRFSNSIAENMNSHIDKVINASYGYRNFRRFRARVMLILTYNKKRKCTY